MKNKTKYKNKMEKLDDYSLREVTMRARLYKNKKTGQYTISLPKTVLRRYEIERGHVVVKMNLYPKEDFKFKNLKI